MSPTTNREYNREQDNQEQEPTGSFTIIQSLTLITLMISFILCEEFSRSYDPNPKSSLGSKRNARTPLLFSYLVAAEDILIYVQETLRSLLHLPQKTR